MNASRIMCIVSTVLVVGSWGTLAMGDVCPDPADPRVHYVAGSHDDPEVCNVTRFRCRDIEGYPEERFRDRSCGCGCKEDDALWRRIKVTEGEPAVVVLDSNASTGYAWEVASTNRTLGYPEINSLPGRPGRIGAPGKTRLTWQTEAVGGRSKVGTHQVVVHYRRPWEDDVAPARVAYLTITILPAPVETCGDPDVAELFEECKSAESAEECLAAGGRWTRAGLAGRLMCLCPTGQEECPCRDGADCLGGRCMAPMGECREVSEGVCGSVAPLFGCLCVIRDGRGSPVCFD